MLTLKPCPFCGGEAEFERIGDRRQSCIVACTMCGCRLESSDEGEWSGSSWNRRHETPCVHELARKFLESAPALWEQEGD